MSLEITSTRRIEPERREGQWLLEVTLRHEWNNHDLCTVRVTSGEMEWYSLFQGAVKRQTNIDFECMHVTPGASSQQQQREWRDYVAKFHAKLMAEAIRKADSGSRPTAEAENPPSDAKKEGDPPPDTKRPLRRPGGRRIIEVCPRTRRDPRRFRHLPPPRGYTNLWC